MLNLLTVSRIFFEIHCGLLTSIYNNLRYNIIILHHRLQMKCGFRIQFKIIQINNLQVFFLENVFSKPRYFSDSLLFVNTRKHYKSFIAKIKWVLMRTKMISSRVTAHLPCIGQSSEKLVPMKRLTLPMLYNSIASEDSYASISSR